MRIIEPSVELIAPRTQEELLEVMEAAGRTCYKSEGKITTGSAEKFVKNILKRGHEAVIEHSQITVRFTCDRGVSHEIVRHRIASFAQESTRYVNYSKDQFGGEITVIQPSELEKDSPAWRIWKRSCEAAEVAYMELLHEGCTPQQARAVLPNSTKTEVVMTANVREWRWFLKLRTAKAAHPDMRQIAKMLYDEFMISYPALFEDIEVEA